jgi:hypothetical protein
LKMTLGTENPRDVPIYSASECARCLGLPASTVRGWVTVAKNGAIGGAGPLIQPADPDPLTLSFINLVEVHVLSAMRESPKVADSENGAGNRVAPA